MFDAEEDDEEGVDADAVDGAVDILVEVEDGLNGAAVAGGV